MKIRHEQSSDHQAIASITTQAFAGRPYSSKTEAEIIARLRDANALTLSLVALYEDTIIGHVAFSPVEIGGNAISWFGLGPVSVRPDRQLKGVGTSLIRYGLKELQARGASGCVVLGDPAYYCRFGFENDQAIRFEGAPAKFFMRLAFDDEVPNGTVKFHSAFNGV